MELNADELDRIIFEIIREHNAGGLRPTREEIAHLVLNYISSHIDANVIASLDRLIHAGKIDEDRGATRGRPYNYNVINEPTVQRRQLD